MAILNVNHPNVLRFYLEGVEAERVLLTLLPERTGQDGGVLGFHFRDRKRQVSNQSYCYCLWYFVS